MRAFFLPTWVTKIYIKNKCSFYPKFVMHVLDYVKGADNEIHIRN